MHQELIKSYTTFIDNLLVKLPVGWILCVHETNIIQQSIAQNFTMETNYHFIGPKMTCESAVGSTGVKTQYGPKQNPLLEDHIVRGTN